MGVEKLTRIDPDFWEEQRKIHAEVVEKRNPQNSKVEKDIFDLLLGLKYDYSDRYDRWRNNYPTDHKHFSAMINDLKHAPAMIIVQNYDPDNAHHYNHTVNGVWDNREYDIVGKYIGNPENFRDLVEIAKHDNALITDPDGIVLAHNVYIDNPELKRLLRQKVFASKKDTLNQAGWEILGFKRRVNARHFAALGGSDELGLPITVYGEDHGDIRRFENGEFTYSSVPGEVQEQTKSLKERIMELFPGYLNYQTN